jgi:hypothetical protein
MKFETAVNNGGLLIEIPCIGNGCAWFFDNHCELCTTNQKKKGLKGMTDD